MSLTTLVLVDDVTYELPLDAALFTTGQEYLVEEFTWREEPCLALFVRHPSGCELLGVGTARGVWT